MAKQELPELPRWDGPLSHPFYSHVVKRVLDLVFALILLIPAMVVMIPLAIWVKLDSPGPVLYKAVRGGYHNKPFYIMKFRSMVVGADKTGGCTAKNDDRVTRAGRVMRRLKLDELPQLWNILIGDMSLVGPRPEMLENVERYKLQLPTFVYREKMKAGLTGYAQIEGKYNTSPEDKLMLDLMYIENFTIWSDIKLLFRTFTVFFKKDSTEGFAAAQTDTSADKTKSA